MEKECKICGKFFETDSPNRLNCEDCSTHYKQRKREYANAYEASKRRMYGLYEPKVIEKTCDGCGKNYKTIQRLLITWNYDGERKYFCTDQCKKRYASSNTYCATCGKSMLNNERFSLCNTTGVFYCSDECETMGKWEIARRNGEVKTCIHCGKEYIGTAKHFCSEECHHAALKDGWRPKRKPRKIKTVMRNCTCIVCGKTVLRECNPDSLMEAFLFICSDECQKEYKKMKAIRKNKKIG